MARNQVDVIGAYNELFVEFPNAPPLLRTAVKVTLVFCCGAPFVLLFSSLVVYGLRSFIH
jgi:hypothetical protein